MNEVHDVFRYPIERTEVDQDFLEHYLNDLKSAKNSEKRRLLSKFIYPISYWNLKKKRSFVFSNSRLLSDIIKGECVKKDSFILSGLRGSLFAIRHIIPYYTTHYISTKLYDIYMEDPTLTSKDASQLIRKTIQIIKLVSPKFIFLSNDSLFLERFLIYCAREDGIKTVCMQHGIFTAKGDFRILDGKYADYIFLWGDSQATIYKNNEFDMRKIRIIGYPHNTATRKENRTFNKKKVCILGQPFENYRIELGNRKKSIFEKLISILMAKGFKIFYKPHPGEKDCTFYPFNANLYKKNLKHALSEFDIFISLTSTALLEASIYGKIAIQLFDENFKVDHFNKLGYSYEYPASDLKNILDFIMFIDKPYTIPKSSILLNEDVSKRFLDILKTI